VCTFRALVAQRFASGPAFFTSRCHGCELASDSPVEVKLEVCIGWRG